MKNVFLIVGCLFVSLAYTQPDSLYIKVKKEIYTGPQWKQKNQVSVDLSEVAFVNWNSGFV